jgi:hypothetical protein
VTPPGSSGSTTRCLLVHSAGSHPQASSTVSGYGGSPPFARVVPVVSPSGLMKLLAVHRG